MKRTQRSYGQSSRAAVLSVYYNDDYLVNERRNNMELASSSHFFLVTSEELTEGVNWSSVKLQLW